MAVARTSNRSTPALRRRGGSRMQIKGRGLLTILAALIAGLAVVPTTIVTLVAMVPTLAALAVDQSTRRYLARSVFGMSLAALWPFLYRLWFHGNDLRTAFGIITDIYTWAAIYGAAGLGWLMFLGLPAMAHSFQVFGARHQLARLRRTQRNLIEEWGEDLVAAPVEPVAEAPKPAELPPAPKRRVAARR